METLRPHLGNCRASVSGQSVWRKRERDETRRCPRQKEGQERRISQTRLHLFQSLLTCAHQEFATASRVPLNLIMSPRWNDYFLISSFSGAWASQDCLILQTFHCCIRVWHEIWALACITSIAEMTQTVPLLSIRGTYSSVLSINFTALTVPLPSSLSAGNIIYYSISTCIRCHSPLRPTFCQRAFS